MLIKAAGWSWKLSGSLRSPSRFARLLAALALFELASLAFSLARFARLLAALALSRCARTRTKSADRHTDRHTTHT